MDIHKNARLTLIRREQLVQAVLVQKMTLQAAARCFHVCARTAAKNWPQRVNVQTWCSACRSMIRSESRRGINCDIWLKMLDTCTTAAVILSVDYVSQHKPG
jgi:hypothetical protein